MQTGTKKEYKYLQASSRRVDENNYCPPKYSAIKVRVVRYKRIACRWRWETFHPPTTLREMTFGGESGSMTHCVHGSSPRTSARHIYLLGISDMKKSGNYFFLEIRLHLRPDMKPFCSKLKVSCQFKECSCYTKKIKKYLTR